MPNRPTSIPGYVHPETNNYSKNTMYKTFTEGLKPTKKETFGTITMGQQYGKTITREIGENTCPVCKGHAVMVSNCAFNIKKCGKHHSWFTDRSGELKIGNPNKKF